MRKSAIRLLSVLMAVILGITSGNIGAYANTISGNDASTSKNMKEHVGISENELDVEGTSSFGKMFAEAIEEKEYEQQKNNGYNIFSIEMNGNTASVELDAVDDCTLVVGIYDEAGEKLLNVGTTTVTAGSEKASLVIDTASESIPTYFYLRGFLVDTYTYRPLCTVYESPNYTQEMQEFFAKTTTDFAADRVLNFDNSADNNFAIYKDDVVVVEENDTSNQFECVDETSQKYVVENADGTVTSLSSGDIFVYEEADEVYIIKVAHVDVDGTTATIYGSDASMEEVFSYIKIDASSDTEDTEVDTTDCDAGVEYAGKVQTPDESTYTTESAENDNTMQEEVDGGGSVSTKLQYNLLDTESVKGSVDFNLELTVKFFLTHSYQYLELKIKYTVGISVSLSDKADCSIKLGELKQVPFFGVIIKEKLCFVVECEAKLSFTGTLSGQIGAKISSDEGVSDLSSAPKLKTEFKGEVSFFVGLGFDPEVEVVSEHIAEAKLKTRVGVEAKGTLAPSENTESERHDCKVCIDGDINFKASASFSAKLFSKWKYTYNIAGFTVKICDWYYSADLNKFGWSNCPNRSYRVDITVQDENGKSINGVNIYVDKNSANMCLNAVNGKAHDYLKMGSHEISVEANGYNSVCQKVKVEEIPRSVVVNLKKIGSSGGGSGNGSGGSFDIEKCLSLGDFNSGVITENGSLYMWGENDFGQIGNGTTRNCLVPMKILDNVKSVSLGSKHSGAITEDGSLYMWGYNLAGQIGNGTQKDCLVPTKILDNVKSVSLKDYHSGAITEDGSLYMWGRNDFGQIGNGTTTDCLVPTKILDNVKSVSLKENHSGAITEDGSLYMWGENDYGQIGNRTTRDCLVPTKILDNVKSVSLGAYYSGAITEDGSLYMWGYNYLGQIGNGTTTNSSVPVKITLTLQTESSETYTESIPDNITVKKVSTQSGTLSLSGLKPNTTYNFYIMKSKDKADVWETDNLLYIKQVNSDSSGNVETSYYSTEAYENADAFWVSAKQTDLSNATVNVSNLTYNGQEQFVKATVTLNGKTLIEGRDFDLEGEYFARNVGNYTVSIKGIGMYCGTKKVTYSVLQKESNKDDNNNNNSNSNNANTSTDNAKTQIESFVKRMYTVALSREAENAGLNDWSSKLSNQEIDGAGIANGFINSAEFKNRNLNNNDYLDVLYRTFFDREADAGGKAYWMGKLQKGISRTEVLSGFVNSQEFSNLCDRFGIARGTMQANGSSIYRPGVRGYVLRMYTKALNRDGETVGVEDWTNRINTKVMSPETVAKSFFSSQEFINRNLNNADYVETLYQTFMDRASDAGGKQYWINKLNSGMSRQQVLEGFSRSEEFSKIMKRYGL